MTRLVRPESETADSKSSGSDPDSSKVAARIRDRAERVRRRELDTALGRFREHGEMTPADQRVLVALAERLTDALVEQWVARLSDDEVDSEAALALLTE